jgi:micrococcal nuclease
MVSKGAVSGIIGAVIVLAAVAYFLVPNPPPQVTVRTPSTMCGGTAGCIRETVSKIVDGDTLDVGDSRIRLALVDTPESNEPGYEAAKDFTAKTCPIGSAVTVDVDDGQRKDQFDRTIGKVWCGEMVLNQELINAGMAEILPEYCNPSEFRNEDWAKGHGC